MKRIALISILSALIATALVEYTNFASSLDYKIYDEILKIRHKTVKPPAEISDIVLVTIDNDTLNNMKQRWPYPRTEFANAVDNLNRAGARTIALDFLFYGASGEKDDAALAASFGKAGNVVLGATVGDYGLLRGSSVAAIRDSASSGIVTKFQDSDGRIRRSLTYLADAKNPRRIVLSWEMQILKSARGIDVRNLKSDKGELSLRSRALGELRIPIGKKTRSFLINFKAHSGDFYRIPFYRAAQGGIDEKKVKGKIVVIGFFSDLLGDIYNTPLGWMPGLIVNANSLLTLLAKDFLRRAPDELVILWAFAGAFLTVAGYVLLKKRFVYLLAAVELVFYIFACYGLLLRGTVFNYSYFPMAVIISAFLAKKSGILT